MRISRSVRTAIFTLCACAVLLLGTQTVNAQPAVKPQTLPTTKPTLPSADRKLEPVGDPNVASPRTGDAAAVFKMSHERLLQRTKQGAIDLLFLGDSITQFWDRYPDNWKNHFGDYKAANYGLAGDRVENLLWRIENGELDGLTPKVIVLMIGTNNTGINPADQIAVGIGHAVTTLRTKCPNSKILLMSILPRSREGEEAKSDAIRAVNNSIAKLDDGTNIRFVDLASKFANPEGRVGRDLMVDGLHPTGKGYDLWGEALETLLEEMMK